MTPVSVYLRLRDHFANSLLLESSEYQSRENCFSYICCKPLATITAHEGDVKMNYPDGSTIRITIGPDQTVPALLQSFLGRFQVDYTSTEAANMSDSSHITSGIFGYLCYDCIEYFEDIHLNAASREETTIPDFQYSVFQYVLVFDHFKCELYLYEHLPDNESAGTSSLSVILSLINNQNTTPYPFQTEGTVKCNHTDQEFLNMVNSAMKHCHRGDVFQIVLSRSFNQQFKGDDFNVYRALRTINPSPYLYYFDYGSFRLFGSSPESQLTVKNGEASLHPIAGTYRRTGDPVQDSRLAEKLKSDPKENAEHVMLVDLARNDLSRHASNVKVASYCEIQNFSHVIHMVSKVTGNIMQDAVIQLLAGTFPAGTLSGAPKHMAMQLIDKYEKQKRSFYGGAIGFIGFDGTLNHAIMIRTFCSKNNTLTYQAGAGIVESSVPENELAEINHKTEALRLAIRKAAEL